MKYKIILIGFITISTAIMINYNPNDKIIYIMVGDKGKESCNGKHDQETINKALSQYSTVYLKGKGSCVIDEPILMPSNTKLKGDSTVVLKLEDNLDWVECKPMIGQRGVVEWKPYASKNDKISNIEISGFQIDGGIQKRLAGTTYFPLIFFYNPYNIKIHDMTLGGSKWDIIRFTSQPKRKDIKSKIYNNKIKDSGHEGVFFVNVSDFEIYDNNISSTRTNCGIRIKRGDRFSIRNNIIGNSLGRESSGYAGILLENADASIAEANISDNLIYGKNSGIVLDGGDSNSKHKRENVHIYNNIIYHTKTATIPYLDSSIDLDGGIRINDFNNTLIESNIIEGNIRDAIIYENRKDNNISYQTLVKNNIIIDNGRYGINNSKKFKQNHIFILKNNLLYNNENNYFNASSNSDIYKKPLFSKPHTIEDNWHHIAVIYDSNRETISIYIDGKMRIEKKYIGFGNINSNDNNLFVGGYRGIAHWFRGKIGLNIWNRALHPEEIRGLYQGSIKKDINGDLIKNIELNSKINLFNKDNRYIRYSSDLSFVPNFTISSWIYKIGKSNNGEYQTIFNKGKQGDEDYIWIYIKEGSIFVELVNRGKYLNIDTSILDLKEIFYINDKKINGKK